MLNHERASVLMLVPAALLVVLVLSSITFDLSLVHLARREALAGAEAAANDAVTGGLDERALRAGEGYVLDPDRVNRVAHRSLAARGLVDRLAEPPRVDRDGSTVRVTLALRVDYVFAPALPGLDHRTVVRASASATAVAR